MNRTISLVKTVLVVAAMLVGTEAGAEHGMCDNFLAGFPRASFRQNFIFGLPANRLAFRLAFADFPRAIYFQFRPCGFPVGFIRSASHVSDYNNNEKSSFPYHFVHEMHKNLIFLSLFATCWQKLCIFAVYFV